MVSSKSEKKPQKYSQYIYSTVIGVLTVCLSYGLNTNKENNRAVIDSIKKKADKVYVDDRFKEHETKEQQVFNSIKTLIEEQKENQEQLLKLHMKFMESIDRRLSNLETRK